MESFSIEIPDIKLDSLVSDKTGNVTSSTYNSLNVNNNNNDINDVVNMNAYGGVESSDIASTYDISESNTNINSNSNLSASDAINAFFNSSNSKEDDFWDKIKKGIDFILGFIFDTDESNARDLLNEYGIDIDVEIKNIVTNEDGSIYSILFENDSYIKFDNNCISEFGCGNITITFDKNNNVNQIEIHTDSGKTVRIPFTGKESGINYNSDYLEIIYDDCKVIYSLADGTFSIEDYDLSKASIFDNYALITGQFGSSQMDVSNQDFANDPLVQEIIKKYYSDEIDELLASGEFSCESEIYDYYLKTITACGCGYAAVVNLIFKYYEGRPEDFEEKFGFPMYTIDENGKIDYNYEYLIIDLFSFSNKNADRYVSFEEMIYASFGVVSATDAALSNNNYKIKGTEFAFEGKWYEDGLLKEYLNLYGLSGELGSIDSIGIKIYNEETFRMWLESFPNIQSLSFYGVDLSSCTYEDVIAANPKAFDDIFFWPDLNAIGDETFNKYLSDLLNDSNKLNEYIKKHRGVTASLPPGSPMYNMDGTISGTLSLGHAVTLIGVGDIVDGELQLIVSSWGKEYIVNYSDLNGILPFDISEGVNNDN